MGSNEWLLPILNIVFYVLNTVITFVSISGAFGKTNTELSEKYQSLITPDGYAFSIWGFIFAGEGLFALTQILKFRDSSILTQGISYWWIAACVAQCCWTFAFAQEVIWLACMFMILIWISLGCILLNTHAMRRDLSEFWLLIAPFQLHFGWITAASAVNIEVLILKIIGCYKGNYIQGCSESDVASQIASTIILLALIFMFGLWMAGLFGRERVNAISTGVLSWATIALYVQLKNAKEDFPEFYMSLGGGAKPITSGIGQASLTVGIILALAVVADILYILGLTPKFDFMAKGVAEMDDMAIAP